MVISWSQAEVSALIQGTSRRPEVELASDDCLRIGKMTAELIYILKILRCALSRGLYPMAFVLDVGLALLFSLFVYALGGLLRPYVVKSPLSHIPGPPRASWCAGMCRKSMFRSLLF